MQNPLISTPRNYAAYKNPNKSMMAILTYPNIAEQAMTSWVAKNFASYQDLATKPFNVEARYVRNEYMRFSNGFVNVGTLGVWSDHKTSNIHRKLSDSRNLFDLFDSQLIEDGDSARVEFARDRGMWRYARISSKLYMLCPRTCAAFLFLSQGDLPIDFRTFIGDHSPEDTYHPRKLYATLIENTKPNVSQIQTLSTTKIVRSPRRVRRVPS